MLPFCWDCHLASRKLLFLSFLIFFLIHLLPCFLLCFLPHFLPLPLIHSFTHLKQICSYYAGNDFFGKHKSLTHYCSQQQWKCRHPWGTQGHEDIGAFLVT